MEIDEVILTMKKYWKTGKVVYLNKYFKIINKYRDAMLFNEARTLELVADIVEYLYHTNNRVDKNKVYKVLEALDICIK